MGIILRGLFFSYLSYLFRFPEIILAGINISITKFSTLRDKYIYHAYILYAKIEISRNTTQNVDSKEEGREKEAFELRRQHESGWKVYSWILIGRRYITRVEDKRDTSRGRPSNGYE